MRRVVAGRRASCSIMPPLLLKLVIDRLGLLGRPARPFVSAQLKLHLDFLEAELGDGPWFLGARFSARQFHLEFMKQGTIPAGYFGEEVLRVLRTAAP